MSQRELQMELYWYGNAFVVFCSSQQRLFFDPFHAQRYRGRALPLPGKTVLVTHGHFDHVLSIPHICGSERCKVYGSNSSLYHLHLRDCQGIPLSAGSIVQIGEFHITALKSDHVHFDAPLVVRTMKRILSQHKCNAAFQILRTHLKHPAGSVFAYLVEVEQLQMLHLGSLHMPDTMSVQRPIDILCLPLQGSSHWLKHSLDLLNRIRPRLVFVHHHDDAFPPITEEVDVDLLRNAMREKFPEMVLHVPQYGMAFDPNSLLKGSEK